MEAAKLDCNVRYRSDFITREVESGVDTRDDLRLLEGFFHKLDAFEKSGSP
jgi:hypothetical protein